MENISLKYYPAKILLFGEYTVIDGSDALAVPFDRFKSKWSFNSHTIKKEFYPFFDYLKNIDLKEYKDIFLVEKLQQDIDEGLFFDSDIPVGYGAGSSGSLSAAVYDRYFKKKSSGMEKIRNILALIEGYFHGISSGIDPLVSYLNKGIKIFDKNDFEVMDDMNMQLSSYGIYLLDSNTKRETKKFVDIYNGKIKTKKFVDENLPVLATLNNKIISSFLSTDEDRIFSLWKEISNFQFSFFEKMIIPHLKDIWKQSLQSSYFSMKLCGAGGGGFYLIIAERNIDIKSYFDDFDVIKAW